MPSVTQLGFGTVREDGRFDGDPVWTDMQQAFTTAAAAWPTQLCEASYRFAGRPVRLRVVGRELFGHIVKPFAHLRIDESPPPELTVELWDDRSIGCLPKAEHANGETLWQEATRRSSDDRFIAQRLPHTLSCLDRSSGRLVAGIAWHDAIFIYERSKPLARLLLTWYNDRHVQVIHTGLVARNGTGVLIAGKSGSGKSTSVLVSVMGGLHYLSEDYVGLETTADGAFVGHSVYNSVFLNSVHLKRFVELGPFTINGRPPQEEKSVVILSQIYPERLARTAAIGAIVFPVLVDDATEARLRPMSKGAALLALAPSSLLQIPNRQLGPAGFDRLAQLVERVPCFEMVVGSTFASIPRCLETLIAALTPCER
jgi:hypothetical protein